MVGVVLGFVGVAWLVATGRETSTAPLLPSAMVLLGAVAWATGSVLAPRLPRFGAGRGTLAAMQMIVGGALLSSVGVAIGEPARATLAIGWPAALAFTYLVLVGSLLAFSAYLFLLDVVPPARVATYAYVNPVVAVALGWTLGETLCADEVVAMVVALGGVALTVVGRRGGRGRGSAAAR